MQAPEDKNLTLIEHELRFISRHANNAIEGNHEAVDEISMAVQSALYALFEFRRELQPVCDEVPGGVIVPEAA